MKNHISFCVNNSKRLTFCFVNELQDVLRFLDEASQLAANNFYSTLQQQSLLLGIKIVIGYLLIAALVIAVISAFIPFHKTLKVAVVKTGDDMV